jgi:hypothetical protein
MADASPAAQWSVPKSEFLWIAGGWAALTVGRKAGRSRRAFTRLRFGVLATPGQWGGTIAVAEGQPLGMAPGAGGETLGAFARRAEHVWKMRGGVG